MTFWVELPLLNLFYKLHLICTYELYSNLTLTWEIIRVFLGLMFLYKVIWIVCHVCIGSDPFGTSPKKNILLQSGCNFLVPITKCWFGISEFLWLAAVSGFCRLLKKLAGDFPSLTIIKMSPSPHLTIKEIKTPVQGDVIDIIVFCELTLL